MYSPFLTAAQKRKSKWSILKMMLSTRLAQPQPIACEDWSLYFQDKLHNSDSLIVVLILFSWYCYWLFTYNASICMKLDPDIHIVMHLVLSLKPGVTLSRACSIVFSYHLLSTNHKCAHPCITAVQSKIIVRSFLKILRSSRRMSPGQLPMKLKICCYSINVYLFA